MVRASSSRDGDAHDDAAAVMQIDAESVQLADVPDAKGLADLLQVRNGAARVRVVLSSVARRRRRRRRRSNTAAATTQHTHTTKQPESLALHLPGAPSPRPLRIPRGLR